MERREGRQRRKRTSPRKRGLFFVGLGIVILLAAGYYVWTEVLPNREHVQPDLRGLKKPIFVEGQIQGVSAIGEKESIKLPLPVVQEIIDPNIRYEKATKTIILTTKDKLIHFKTDQLTGQVNSKPFQLHFAAEQVKDTIYLPLAPLQELYGMKVEEHPETGIVMLMRAGDRIKMAKVPAQKDQEETVPMRTGPSIHEPIVADIAQGAALRIWDQTDDWYKVQLDNGYVGYVKQSDVILDQDKLIEQLPEESFEWNGQGKPINLIWEAVYNRNPDPYTFDELPGVNVVSPTWFSLLDGQGNIQSKADARYVRWAHDKGMQVWALFSNSFEPKMTTSALSSFEIRFQMIQQLLSYAKMYRLDGINIDFENVYTKDMQNVTQFVRELTPMLHEQGLVVSIDVTPKSNSEMWSAFLDRRSLGQIVDYMMVMSYDEHWAASPIAGSVASLPWVERAIIKIMDEDDVPANKLLLGMPLYTRIWSETAKKGGGVKVSSKTASMKKVQDILEKFDLKPQLDPMSGQNYVEYTEGGILKKIWIEDRVSVKARVELARRLNLAGTATWTRSFAVPEIWDIISPQDSLD